MGKLVQINLHHMTSQH